MAVKVMYECPISGRVWTPGDEYHEVVIEKKQDENGNEVEEVKEYPLNSVNVSFYDHSKREMKYIAYARDVSPDIMRQIAALLFQGENSKVRIQEAKKLKNKTKKPGRYKPNDPVTKTEAIDAEQAEFAANVGEDNDTN